MVHYAAGILPITWHEGHLLFLVGRDLRDGWSDFGGKCERVDRGSAMHTAAREFYEETYGTVTSAKSLLQHMTCPENTVLMRSSTQNGYAYYMFLTEVPYMPHLRGTFRKVLRFLQTTSVQRVYVEKTDIQWVTWEMLQEMPKRPVFAATIALHKDTLDAIAASAPSTWRRAAATPTP